ncbi:alpha,alpha-trehalase TreF [Pedobacter sp.]|nr:alpha,alpha-trehalase TreF [Candidatus Saccharibacteria bacterium]
MKKYINTDRVSSLRIEAAALAPKLKKQTTPEKEFEGLFHDVQSRQIHADSKAFVDAVPLKGRREILKLYKLQRDQPGFDLLAFISTYFSIPGVSELVAEIDTDHTMSEHISGLWAGLERQTLKKSGSLLEVPYPYIVPGGRFNELFYWDSYFIMLGLTADGRINQVEAMTRDFAYLLRRHGYIPTANRTYLTSRSQPPFFAHMVQLLAAYKGKSTYLRYLPYLLTEHRFWMKGSRSLRAVTRPASKRVAIMPDGTVLNRYYDDSSAPRPESYPEDIETAELAVERQAAHVFLDVRAAAESGWDFSSRWLKDGHSLATIQTTDLIPVDLNCLLYQLEMTIARTYSMMLQKQLAKKFSQAAEQRAATIRRYCWDEKRQFFFDFNFVTGQRSAHQTLAGVFPLYAGIATQAQADAVAGHIKELFLKDGGVVTTLVSSGQQWDAPNGWAPLQLVTIYALRRYGHHELADEIKRRWIACNQMIYDDRHKLVEKYNVVHPGSVAGGGEYALQDGFGWTNGVLQALLKEDDILKKAIMGPDSVIPLNIADQNR